MLRDGLLTVMFIKRGEKNLGNRKPRKLFCSVSARGFEIFPPGRIPEANERADRKFAFADIQAIEPELPGRSHCFSVVLQNEEIICEAQDHPALHGWVDALLKGVAAASSSGAGASARAAQGGPASLAQRRQQSRGGGPAAKPLTAAAVGAAVLGAKPTLVSGSSMSLFSVVPFAKGFSVPTIKNVAVMLNDRVEDVYATLQEGYDILVGNEDSEPEKAGGGDSDWSEGSEDSGSGSHEDDSSVDRAQARLGGGDAGNDLSEAEKRRRFLAETGDRALLDGLFGGSSGAEEDEFASTGSPTDLARLSSAGDSRPNRSYSSEHDMFHDARDAHGRSPSPRRWERAGSREAMDNLDSSRASQRHLRVHQWGGDEQSERSSSEVMSSQGQGRPGAEGNDAHCHLLREQARGRIGDVQGAVNTLADKVKEAAEREANVRADQAERVEARGGSAVPAMREALQRGEEGALMFQEAEEKLRSASEASRSIMERVAARVAVLDPGVVEAEEQCGGNSRELESLLQLRGSIQEGLDMHKPAVTLVSVLRNNTYRGSLLFLRIALLVFVPIIMIFIRIYKRLRARHGKKGSKAHASGDGGNFNITADALSLGRSHSSDFVRTSTSTRDNDKSTLSKMRAVKEATKRSRLKKEAQSKKWGVDYRAEGDRSPHDRERTQVSSPTDRAGHSEREGSHVFPRSGSHDREAYWDATLSPVQAPESPSRAKETAFSSVRRESHGGPRSPLRRSPLGRSPLGAVVPRPQAGYLSATLGGGGGGGGGGDVSRTGGGARGGNAPQTPKGGGREREPRVGRRPSSRDPDLQ